MQYKTIILELLQQRPEIHEQLRMSRKLLTTVKNLNRTLKGWPLSFRAGTKRDLIGWERLV